LAALEALCHACWPPVYAYIRRLGKDPEESRDLTQSFLAHQLASGAVAGARPERGRFRNYLLGALRHFLADAHDYALAWKRGGGREVVSLDALKSEESYGWEPADHRSPDQVFERHWALALMLRALHRLEEECRLSGKEHLFRSLKGFLTEGATDQTYPEAAAELGVTEANARMLVSRLRRRYGGLVRAEVSETLDAQADVDDELRYLLRLLRGE
jgi:RNA polymerase sigma-70 factor (ECF subfamily)